MKSTRSALRTRSLAAIGAASCLALVASPLAAQAADGDRWDVSVEHHETGVNNGYQLAFDELNGKVYFTDAKWRSETRGNGTKESAPLDWAGVTLKTDGDTSHSSMRTTFSPYGVAVDGKLGAKGTAVTTTARQQDSDVKYGGGVVIYDIAQGAPTDADRVFEFADGEPVFNGPRRVAVDEQRHRAYVTSLGNSRSGGEGEKSGFIVVLDLTKRGADAVLARVSIPNGAVGVDVDEANNQIYVGSMVGEKLYKIDGDAIDTSAPQDLSLNNGAVTALDASVGANARPTYSPELKRVYSSAYASSGTIAVVDADPASATYGQLIDSIATGPTNAVAVDGDRGLLYSANLGDQKVAVFDTETHDLVHEVPTSGNAINLGINDATGEVWASNFAASGKTDVFTVSETDTTPTPETPAETTTPGRYGNAVVHSAQWTSGQQLVLKGTGWQNTTKTEGSNVAIKVLKNGGALKPVNPAELNGVVENNEVWAWAKGDAAGNFEVTVDFPSAANTQDFTDSIVAEGTQLRIQMLRGTFGTVPNEQAEGLAIDIPIAAPPAPVEPTTEWSHTYAAGSPFATGVNNGYQLAYDDDHDAVYFTDAKWRSEKKNPAGELVETVEGTGKLVEFDANSHAKVADHSFLELTRNDKSRPITVSEGTGKVVAFDAATRAKTEQSFLGLTRNDGSGKESDPFDWSNAADDLKSQSSMRTTFSPYGIAVDGALDGGTIVTTTARQQDSDAKYGGGVVIYTASQGAPTDADRVFEFEDGTPIFAGVRRVAVNENTHQAFVTNLGNSRGGGEDGFIAVLDLTKRGADAVQARITVPDANGAIGVDVDQENNKVYVGSYAGDKLYVIDGDEIDTSDPKDLSLNDDAIEELDAVVGPNARPSYSPELKRVYSSSYDENTIAVVDADPESDGYGELIDTIETGPTNAVAVDGVRGLVYSANLGDREVVAFDTENHEQQFAVPTSGNAVNLGIDPQTRQVWVSNFSSAGVTDVITVVDTQAPAVPENWRELVPGSTEELLQLDQGELKAVQNGTNVTISDIPLEDRDYAFIYGYSAPVALGAHLVAGGSTTVSVAGFAPGQHHLAVYDRTHTLLGYVPFSIAADGTGGSGGQGGVGGTGQGAGAKTGGLSNTGGESLAMLGVAAGALLVLGAGSVLIARRRGSAE